MKLIKLRNIFIEGKILISRSTGYLAIFNTGMILFLFLGDLKTKGYIDWDLGNNLILIYTGTMILFIGLGAIEVYLIKGTQREAHRSFELNPLFMDMKNKVDYLYKKEVGK